MNTLKPFSFQIFLLYRIGTLVLFCLVLMVAATIVGREMPERLIAYTVVQDMERRALYVMDINRELSHRASQQNVECCLAWSPDGSQIAFTARTGARLDIYVEDIFEGHPYPPIDNQANNTAAAWSPDGQSIAYVAEFEGVYDINAIELATGRTYQVNSLSLAKSSPAWSPDGAHLVFLASFGWKDFQLFGVTVGDETPFFLTSAITIGSPSFSPDGDQILFSGANGGGRRLYTIALNSQRARQITDQADDNSLFPSWSSDGTQILFSSSRDGDHEIYIMDADGENMRQITNNQRNDLAPVWSPDGQQILFISKRGSEEIHVINIDGSNERRLAVNTVNDAVWQP
jgi:Tol biopolymer transport system component